MNNIIKIGIVFGILSLFISSSFATSNNIKITCNNYNKDVEYWGICIVAFDDYNAEHAEPFIYNSLLESDNWDEAHLKLLLHEEATREAILESLDWLIVNADEDDVVLFSDHSHGTYRSSDKKYGIVPIDSEVSGIITVEELDEKFDLIKAKELCLIFDCCLSGSFVKKQNIGVNKINREIFYNKGFTKGIEGDNRIVLMSTMKDGSGIGLHIKLPSGQEKHITFHKFLGDAFGKKIDYNNDDICSAEESFSYAKKKMLPIAFLYLLQIRMQIKSFQETGFFIIPIPTLSDNIQGELPIIL